jgi:hypothetical protein
VAAGTLPSLPYRVRYGAWARNLYLGFPGCLALGLVSAVAPLPIWASIASYAFLGFVATLCLVPRETIFRADGSVVVTRRLLALLPLWRRTYRRSELRAVRSVGAEYGLVGEPVVAVGMLCLVTARGQLIRVQSDSAGADPEPSVNELRRILPALTGLPLET